MNQGISAGRAITKKLREEFGVSKVTVCNALNYKSDSQLQSKIRLRAKVLMEENLKETNERLNKEEAL